MTRCVCGQREVCAEPWEPECGLGNAFDEALSALEGYVEQAYPRDTHNYPTQKLRFDGEMRVVTDARAELTGLRAEVARLKEAHEQNIAVMFDNAAHADAQIVALNVELERWREAVRWHAAWPSHDVTWTHSGGAEFELPVAESIALRASLTGAG